MSVRLEDPVVMCHTDENAYWCHGWVDKTKFRGRLLSGGLEGEEDKWDVFAGTVHHGWLVTVAGDTSGCGWDMTMYFLTNPLPEGATHYGTTYDEDEAGNEVEVEAEIVDGPHKATWWERGHG